MAQADQGGQVASNDSVRNFVDEAGQYAGLDDVDRPLFVDSLVEADLRGVDTHGIVRVPAYVRGFTQRLVNPRPILAVTRRKGSIAVVDADNGLGAIVGQKIMDMAIDIAATQGVGLVAVRNSIHAGMLAQHVIRASDAGMMGYFVSNGPTNMAPWGGRELAISNNPVAYSFPRAGEPPIVFDMACSAIARGKLRRAAQNDSPIPLGWAIDEFGSPTTDPHAGMRGSLMPMGGHKGYGLAVVNEILSVALSGALFSYEVSRAFMAEGAQALDSWKVGHLVAAIDIDGFLDRSEYLASIERLVDKVKSVPPAVGFAEVMLPGEIETMLRGTRLIEGIPISATTLALLDSAADEFGIARLSVEA